ncbi:MAG: hypothetical protein AAF958_05280 [Planctomycetota bacterium]
MLRRMLPAVRRCCLSLGAAAALALPASAILPAPLPTPVSFFDVGTYAVSLGPVVQVARAESPIPDAEMPMPDAEMPIADAKIAGVDLKATLARGLDQVDRWQLAWQKNFLNHTQAAAEDRDHVDSQAIRRDAIARDAKASHFTQHLPYPLCGSLACIDAVGDGDDINDGGQDDSNARLADHSPFVGASPIIMTLPIEDAAGQDTIATRTRDLLDEFAPLELQSRTAPGFGDFACFADDHVNFAADHASASMDDGDHSASITAVIPQPVPDPVPNGDWTPALDIHQADALNRIERRIASLLAEISDQHAAQERATLQRKKVARLIAETKRGLTEFADIVSNRQSSWNQWVARHSIPHGSIECWVDHYQWQVENWLEDQQGGHDSLLQAAGYNFAVWAGQSARPLQNSIQELAIAFPDAQPPADANPRSFNPWKFDGTPSVDHAWLFLERLSKRPSECIEPLR